MDNINDYSLSKLMQQHTFGMPAPNRGFDSQEYRYGFQGQEKDSELKGEGLSVNYKFRMYDTRLGKFLSLDPLASDYPHNSPFAFAENRIIDGIELEGAEYLNRNEAMIEMSYGFPIVKLSNASDEFRDAYLASHPSSGLVYDGIPMDRITVAPLVTIEREPLVDGLEDSRILNQQQKVSHTLKAQKIIFSRINNFEFIGKNKKDGNPHLTSFRSGKNWKPVFEFKTQTLKAKNVEITTGRQSGKTNAGRGAGLIDLMVQGYNMYKNIKISDDLSTISEQSTDLYRYDTWGDNWILEESVLSKALEDVKGAINNGMIPPEMASDVRFISDVTNIVLFGGNGNESKNAVIAGEKLLESIFGPVQGTKAETETKSDLKSSEQTCIPCSKE